MPTFSEFTHGFGPKELFLTLLVVAIIIFTNEGKRLFRRNK